MTAPSDIKPDRLNVEPERKRRRRPRQRNRPDPSPNAKAAEPKALARMTKRPIAPGVMLEPNEHDGWTITPPHADADLWELALADAMGTRSLSVMRVFVTQLKELCQDDWDAGAGRWKTREDELNAAIAMVADIQPVNTAEAALAAQMVAVHWLTMRLAKASLGNGGMPLEKEAALASKMARTYTMQLDALRGLKGGGKRSTRQTIKVTRQTHYHQHIHDHREPPQGGQIIEAQPHDARAEATPQLAALPSPKPGGEVVRLPCRKRKAGLS